jgi:hypothetical protein
MAKTFSEFTSVICYIYTDRLLFYITDAYFKIMAALPYFP